MTTTVVTLVGAGQTYTTIQGWLTTHINTRNLVTDDKIEVCALKNELFDEDITMTGFTTATGATPAQYIVIRAATAAETGGASAKHTGAAGSGARWFSNRGGSFGIIHTDGTISVVVQDMELYSDGIAGSDTFLIRPHNINTGLIHLENCIFHDFKLNLLDDSLAPNADKVIIRNCAGWDMLKGLWGDSGATTKLECQYTVLVHDDTDNDVSDTGFRYAKVTNCAAFYFGASGGHADYLNIDASSANYASSDTSGSSAGIRSLVASNQFVSATSPWNLHLKTGSALEAAGTNIAAVGTDFEGDARDGSTPDIGFDEFVAAASSAWKWWMKKPFTGGFQDLTGGFDA